MATKRALIPPTVFNEAAPVYTAGIDGVEGAVEFPVELLEPVDDGK